jgi:hypothetical protein
MSAYFISQLFLFVCFYNNLKDIYEDIERISFAFYKLELATFDLVIYHILRNIISISAYMTEINSQFT